MEDGVRAALVVEDDGVEAVDFEGGVLDSLAPFVVARSEVSQLLQYLPGKRRVPLGQAMFSDCVITIPIGRLFSPLVAGRRVQLGFVGIPVRRLQCRDGRRRFGDLAGARHGSAL